MRDLTRIDGEPQLSLPPPATSNGPEGPPEIVALRRNWDPKSSPLIDEVLQRLTELYQTGVLTFSLSPQTLTSLGGDFAAFYHAGFHRVGRPRWAIERFPNGFSDVVIEVNTKLESSGIQIANSKQEVCLYGRLPQSSLEVINVFAELFQSGEIDRREAIKQLRDSHQIMLSAAQQKYYFPELRAAKQTTRPVDKSFLERRSALITRIESLKSSVGLDLRIRQCVQGLVLESFVGAYLSHRYGSSNVVCQMNLPIAYRDLYGKPHKQVYLDFFVNSDETKSVIEVKLGNSFEQILNSALPQLTAIEQHTQMQQEVTVVYLKPCPLMRFAIDSGIRVTEELDAMQLSPLMLTNRRLNEMVHYISIEDLLCAEEVTSCFVEALPKLEIFLATADTSLLRVYEDALRRIAGAPPEVIPERLAKLMTFAEGLSQISAMEAQALFGKLSQRSDGGETGVATRIKIIQRSLNTVHDAILMKIYEVLEGTVPPCLDEAVISRLESYSEAQFTDAVLMVLARQEESVLARLRARDERATRPVAEVISAFQLISARDRANHAEYLQKIRVKMRSVFDRVENLLSKRGNEVELDAPNAIRGLMTLGARGRYGSATLPALVNQTLGRLQVQEMSRRIFSELARELRKLGSVMPNRQVLDKASIDLQRQIALALEEFDRKVNLVLSSPIRGLVSRNRKKIKNSMQGRALRDLASDLNYFETGSRAFRESIVAMTDYLCAMLESTNNPNLDLLQLAAILEKSQGDPNYGVLFCWARVAEASMARTNYHYQSAGRTLGALRNDEEFLTLIGEKLSIMQGATVSARRLNDCEGILRNMIGNIDTISDNFSKYSDLSRATSIDAMIVSAYSMYDASFAVFIQYGFDWMKPRSIMNRLSRKPPDLVVPEITPEILDKVGLQLVERFDRAQLWSYELIADFFYRKVVQARILHYFSPEMAREYLSFGNPRGVKPKMKFQEIRDIIVPASDRADELFAGLILHDAKI